MQNELKVYSKDEFSIDIKEILLFLKKSMNYETFLNCVVQIYSFNRLKKIIKEEGNDPPIGWNMGQLLTGPLFNIRRISTFINYLSFDSRTKNTKEQILTLKLYVYLQVLETKLYYKVIGNSLKALLGEETKSEIYDNIVSGHDCFKSVKATYTKLIDSGKKFDIFEKWEYFMDSDLRNAIAHNNYHFLSPELIIIINKWIVQNSMDAEPPNIIYKAEKIDCLYQNAKNFNEAFLEVIEDRDLLYN